MEQSDLFEGELRMRDYKAAIFDLDGTLVDSYKAWERAFCIELKDHGVIVSKEEFVAVYKMTDTETRDFLKGKIHTLRLGLNVEQIYALLFKSMEQQYEHSILPKAGAVAFVETLYQEGIPLCVATLTHDSLAHKVLSRIGITPFLKFIITGDHVGISKKFPDIYIEATRRLGCTVHQTAVFEDSFTAIKTANKAGFMVYGVHDEHQRYDFNDAIPYTRNRIFNWTAFHQNRSQIL